ncbi:hypothetical protein SAY86_022785 [Trapa natans]|uniref:Uncharacterized protein n=1 Tax=Trapa natans TaxID=22666 RepID=A0AAN7R8Q0_TRANT|nr:hypothetical protein SAY86_022785 [Trapa natans]
MLEAGENLKAPPITVCCFAFDLSFNSIAKEKGIEIGLRSKESINVKKKEKIPFGFWIVSVQLRSIAFSSFRSKSRLGSCCPCEIFKGIDLSEFYRLMSL